MGSVSVCAIFARADALFALKRALIAAYSRANPPSAAHFARAAHPAANC